MRTSLLLVGFLLAGMRPVPVSASVTPNGNQLWHLDVPLVNEVAVADDHFGAALATGDFDDDGFDDLAIGIPRRDFLFGVDNIGAVLILYGTSQGLATAGQQVLTQGGAEIEDGDRFGGVLASGDFDGDGYDDLAVGVPLEDLPGGGGDLVNAGVVTVFYCSSGGLGSPEMWHQNVSGVPGAVEEFDLFGASLAVADFDRDGYDELVIGSPGDDVGGLPEAGLVIVLPGAASGLTGMGSQRFRQGFDGIADTAEFRDRFGQTLAVGDFGNDSYVDLAIGAPYEDDETLGVGDCGAVHVLYSGPGGLDPATSQFLQQGTFGIPGPREPGDSFGSSLAAGRVDGDREFDLLVGAPGETISALADGQVHVLFGGIGGVPNGGNLVVNDDTPGVNSGLPDNSFGQVVGSGDLDGDGRDEAIVGIPLQGLRQSGVPDLTETGLVWVISGTHDLSTIGGFQRISHETGVATIAGPAADFDRFGAAVAVGDFDGDGAGELVVGIPGRDVGGKAAAGAVVVLTSALFADGFESGDTSAWSP